MDITYGLERCGLGWGGGGRWGWGLMTWTLGWTAASPPHYWLMLIFSIDNHFKNLSLQGAGKSDWFRLSVGRARRFGGGGPLPGWRSSLLYQYIAVCTYCFPQEGAYCPNAFIHPRYDIIHACAMWNRWGRLWVWPHSPLCHHRGEQSRHFSR